MADRWIVRRGTPRSGFTYVDDTGRTVRDRSTIERITKLRIPPAWKDVRIASKANASVQAWGFDARGRRQYRYHERAVERGQLRKYHRVRRMGHDLPSIRRRVAQDVGSRELTKTAVSAAAVRLIGEAFFRVGSERYQRDNGTFGLTTLRKSHVTLHADRVQFDYRGKGSIRQRQVVFDRQLALVVTRMMKTPGPRLFRYREHERGRWIDLTAQDVNDYLGLLSGAHYTAKDFRTWGGTLRMATVLSDLGPAASNREATRNVTMAARLVAAELGNTPAICRASYVHPLIIARYIDAGVTIEAPDSPMRRRSRQSSSHTPEERALLGFLDRYFPDRRHRRVQRTKERREDLLAA